MTPAALEAFQNGVKQMNRLTLRRRKDYWPRVYCNGRRTKFYINEGSFTGTSDDRLGRWYVQSDEDQFSRKFGPGHRTQADALEEIREIMHMEALNL